MIYLIDLEYVETRYTSQWKTEFPQSIADKTGQDIVVIEGPDDIANGTTPGAFLDFAGTNIYKAEQVKIIADLFQKEQILDGDHFVFADAWHPGVLQLKYMAELLNIKIVTHGLWHAGSYDMHDFLGRRIGDAKWVRHTEYAMFDAFDRNYFASQFHIGMFASVMFDGQNDTLTEVDSSEYLRSKIVRTGWPMEYLNKHITSNPNKEDIILFPHRDAPEKQLNIFKDLAQALPQYEWVNCNDYNLTKPEYNKLLEQSKMVFSANLQETLGISCYEILKAGGIPLVPNRLSYKEMYEDIFKYPSKSTENWKDYQDNKTILTGKIETMMNNFGAPEIQDAIVSNRNMLEKEYFSATNLYQELMNEKL